jgi:hypothetical protein
MVPVLHSDEIDPVLCSLVVVEQVAKAALKLGTGSLLTKIDIKSWSIQALDRPTSYTQGGFVPTSLA